MTYINPSVFAKSYTCPHCGAISKQDWSSQAWNGQSYTTVIHNVIRIGTCHHCSNRTLWLMEDMIYPDTGNAPFPNPEMPDKVKNIYIEAASIHLKSPRGAAALLRFGIQILCKELGELGTNINADIASLVKKGLPEIVQQSLYIVRVTGNDAVHPGQIDTDNPETVLQLFNLINIIVEYMIALPKKVSGIYASLPADKVAGIIDRDKK